MLVTQSSMSVQQMEPPHGRQECFLASVLVPRASSTRDILALETAMQGLAQDDRHAVALELAATATSRGFLLRATSAMALSHLCSQVQARYPQAIIQPVAIGQDPLALHDGEEVSVVELCAGAAAYLPLRAFREREWQQEGADPLLGILGVFNHLPPQMRVVTQLALLPASPTWSSPYLRKAVEHPLEQEHLRARSVLSGRQASGPGTFQLVGLGVLVALLLVWWRFQKQINAHIPAWVVQAGLSLLHGKAPQLSHGQASLLIISSIVAFVALFSLAFLIMQIRSSLGGTSIYDRRLVEEKTARPAYRVRLRLFVFSTSPDHVAAVNYLSWWALVRRLFQQPFNKASLLHAYQSRRADSQQRMQEREARREVLGHLAAAYRQYHTASGGYFVPRRLSQRKSTRVLGKSPGGKQRAHLPGWAEGLSRSSHWLSVADLASLWHLPQTHDLADLPYLERARARTALAPRILSLGQGWRIGISSHAGHTVPVFLPPECLRHNLLAVASTGKGKSTLFQHLAQALCLLRQGTDESVRPGWPSSSRTAMSSARSAGCCHHTSGTVWCWSTWRIVTTRWASTRSIWWAGNVTRRSIPSSLSPNTCGRPATVHAPKTCSNMRSKPWPMQMSC
jgi:hypothetical protein